MTCCWTVPSLYWIYPWYKLKYYQFRIAGESPWGQWVNWALCIHSSGWNHSYGFLSQRASSVENASIWWRHHDEFCFGYCCAVCNIILYIGKRYNGTRVYNHLSLVCRLQIWSRHCRHSRARNRHGLDVFATVQTILWPNRNDQIRLIPHTFHICCG